MKTIALRLNNKDGFTLLELLIALAVLAIGLLGIAGMMVSAIQGNAFGGKMSMAENLASQRLEFFKNLGYGSITREIGLAGAGCTFSTSIASTCGAGTATENYGEVDCGNATYSRLRRETTMQFLNYADPNNPTTTTDCASDGNPKLMTVTVQWVDSTNTTRTVRMMGVFAR